MKSAEFATFNRLADEMTFYHTMLRSSWDQLYAGSDVKSKLPASKVIAIGIQFCRHLTVHHNIEETTWFPVLAKKMPGFREGEFAKTQHQEMHKGLDVLHPYLIECQKGARDFRREEVRTIMDSFSGILWQHMDEEVVELGAQSMKRYWTLEEMKRMPF
ncbi:protein of unknown function [Taphrina deformans PYCC 5710]|uniref:Hemerythrin-like domain-containing protein n=1 Tax=Taphrina deformans (strain PYCC 5710 / ATCC 11124 / CBS 356.35 / IMI 108563 / JCM 9778 / NBRC 8474) TaxID=1097556 RepID=R4XNJ0_TAPDE|nr:protein of unknown function [Taphrina deformans PYCC 5710]|eukprot:CCG84809.1 protein of unknown function [Taphrina deformans PYCC 5710]